METAKATTVALDSLSAHVLLATLSCKSGLSRIPSSRLAWKVTQSIGLKSVRSGGWIKKVQHVVALKTGTLSELSAEQEDRHTGEADYFIIMMLRISGVAEACIGT